MIRNCDRSLFRMPQMNMATFLIFDIITFLQQNTNKFFTRNNRQLHTRTATVVNSLFTERGTPSSAKDSKCNSIASLIFFNASFLFFPWLIHPDKEGTVTVNQPFSSFSSKTFQFNKNHLIVYALERIYYFWLFKLKKISPQNT